MAIFSSRKCTTTIECHYIALTKPHYAGQTSIGIDYSREFDLDEEFGASDKLIQDQVVIDFLKNRAELGLTAPIPNTSVEKRSGGPIIIQLILMKTYLARMIKSYWFCSPR